MNEARRLLEAWCVAAEESTHETWGTNWKAMIEGTRKFLSTPEEAPAELPNTIGIDEFVAELEKDPAMREHIAQARTRIRAMMAEEAPAVQGEAVGICCYGGMKPKSACASCAAWREVRELSVPPPPAAQGEAVWKRCQAGIMSGCHILTCSCPVIPPNSQSAIGESVAFMATAGVAPFSGCAGVVPAAQPEAKAAPVAKLIAACERLSSEAEEYDFPDGMGRGAPQDYWDEFEEALEAVKEAHPSPEAERIEELEKKFNFSRWLERTEAAESRCRELEAERDRLRYALEIVAGLRQPADNLMSNADIARAALAAKETPK